MLLLAPFPHRLNVVLTEKTPSMWYYGEFQAEECENLYRCTTCGYAHEDRQKMREHLRSRHYCKFVSVRENTVSTEIKRSIHKTYHIILML